ncbi:hypothetical protein BYT27DRAFT_7030284, partial [Phlegmacium glaucopus]
HDFEPDVAEWEAISLVAHWLRAFCSATTNMSTTKKPMISTVHAIFCGLQVISRRFWTYTALPQLGEGLLAAHQNLSEYYYISDESPCYTW